MAPRQHDVPAALERLAQMIEHRNITLFTDHEVEQIRLMMAEPPMFNAEDAETLQRAAKIMRGIEAAGFLGAMIVKVLPFIGTIAAMAIAWKTGLLSSFGGPHSP